MTTVLRPPTPDLSAITLESITKNFSAGSVAALAGVSLDVLPGTCTAILGPSGSGKSTLLRVIAGLDDPSGGRVLVNGRDVTDVLPERRGIGMVFQRPLLFPYLNVIDNVAFAARATGRSRMQARTQARPFLDMVGLSGFASRAVHSLSGGQEQRVAIARVLAAKPAILLLDEPFSALDPALREEMHELLREIRRELSPTIVLVTHDREEAAAVADRIALIEGGCLLQHASVDEVYRRPASRAVSRLMGGKNSFFGTVRAGVHESELGRLAVPESSPEGEGYLVFRQESVGVSPVPLAAAPTVAGLCDLDGQVLAIGASGARRTAVVSVANAQVHVELPAGRSFSPGDQIRISLSSDSLFVVPR